MVKRSDQIKLLGIEESGGQIQAEVAAGPFTMTLIEDGDRICLVSVIRDDKNRIENPAALRVPAYLAKPAFKLARREFSKRKSIVTERMMKDAKKADYRHRKILGDDY